MPIKIIDGLSAKEKLHEEGIATIDRRKALHQDIRPLRILILNLMPLKKITELQYLRLLGDSPLQIEVDFCHTVTHISSNTDASYLDANYRTYDEIKDTYYDGFIITGAPVETLPFEEVDYWPELVKYLDWSRTHVYSTLSFCWGAQAALYHFYHIKKQLLPQKLFGIYEYQLTRRHHPLLRGFDDRYLFPSHVIRLSMMSPSTIHQNWKSFHAMPKTASISSARRTTANSLFSAISNTTGIHWPRNIHATRIKAFPSLRRPIIIPIMMTAGRRPLPGAVMPISSIITGSTWSTRKHRIYRKKSAMSPALTNN